MVFCFVLLMHKINMYFMKDLLLITCNESKSAHTQVEL